MLAGSAGTYWLLGARKHPEEPAGPPPDPRQSFASPYRNVKADVAYVGDARCAECHRDIADRYRQHPMGQALGRVGDVPVIEKYGEGTATTFKVDRLEYQIARRGEQLLHTEILRDVDGSVLYSREEPVAFVLGSGRRGRSYLIDRDGRLFQSPISWYSQKGLWDISPGYQKRNLHFERPVNAGCLFCHANQVQAVPNRINQFVEPIFSGYAIGCERCHGPGQLHADAFAKGDAQAAAHSIVNPKDLPPELRESVCEQCHLQGEVRVPRPGRDVFDYRPGLPLREFLSLYVRAPEMKDNKAVGQVEQMYESVCFQKSGGQLGCISCHDPHGLPAPERKDAFFREACLKCHSAPKVTCSEATAARQRVSDRCAACHMQPAGSTDIAHTAVTDHRIRRRPTAPAAPKQRPQIAAERSVELFHDRYLDAPGRAARERDFGMALSHVAQWSQRLDVAERALPSLNAGLKAWPGDVDALAAKAECLNHTGRRSQSLTAYHSLLAACPTHELGLREAALLYREMGKLEESVAYWQRLIEVNPHFAEYHFGLAGALTELGRWKQARDAAREAVRLEPSRTDPHMVLISSALHLGDAKQAEAEFDKLLRIHPEDAAGLRNWYAQQRALAH